VWCATFLRCVIRESSLTGLGGVTWVPRCFGRNPTGARRSCTVGMCSHRHLRSIAIAARHDVPIVFL
jgi:hypothetical protein